MDSRSKRIVIGVVVLASLFLVLLHVWPLPQRLEATPYATLMLDREGGVLGARIARDDQWRFAPVDTLPEKYRQALLRYEDRRFHWHPGVDPLAIVRAAWQNWQAGEIVSGGSTLTMQLARMLRDDPPRTLIEKAREAWLALQLEWHFSKGEILSLYASRAPFGGNIVGLRAAARHYFARKPANLSWAEAALLAVLPNAPAQIHPGRNRERLRARRDALLCSLHRAGKLDRQDLRLARLEPLPEPSRALPRLAPRLLTTLMQEHPQPVLRTRLDAGLQRRVRELARRHGRRLADDGVHNVAVVVVDHEQLATRAYVGNVSHGDADTYGASVDIARARRSTGSILKPLLYGLMLDEGLILPDTLVPDLPTDYGGYTPENFDQDFRGAVPAHKALSESLNVPAVRMLHRYGIGRFQSQLQRMGMTTLFRSSEEYGLTLILGGAEAKLAELTRIYARLFVRATGRQAGAVRWLDDHASTGEPPPPFPLGPGAAWLTLEALRDVARPGTARQWRIYESSQPIAWKTGTSYGLRDAWAIGSNGRYTVGVWAGNANGEGAPRLGGTASAAPLMLDVFSLLGPASWPEPPRAHLERVAVCRDNGYLAGNRCDAVERLAPRDSHFESVTPHHVRVHLDENGQRVHSGCEAVSAMRHENWFVLPPAQAWYYRRHHPEYRPLPAWRSDCLDGARTLQSEPPMALIYPHAGAELFIPVELSGRRGRAVFRAVHQRDGASLFWHLDDRYLGRTRHFHEWAIQAAPGWHTLTLVDDRGFRLRRRFKILGE